MKKLVFPIILLLSTMLGHAANDDVIVDGVVYTWYANTTAHEYGYIAAGWDEKTPIQSLHILGKVNELDVIGIKANAFEDNLDIEYVKIDEGITSIGQNAFFRCTNLKCAVLPEGLVIIEEEAFAFCTALEMFVIPSSVRDIRARAFMGCTGVTDVYFLMTTDAELDEFVWWDGWYQNIPGDYDNPDPHGGIEFNRSRKPYEGEDERIGHNLESGTLIHVPEGTSSLYEEKLEAWLYIEDKGCHPLWWIVNFGVVNREYTVCDDLTAVYVDRNNDLYAKDDNEWLMPDKIYSGEIDYMGNSGFDRASNFDQSNWVVLRGSGLPVGRYVIDGGSITGILKDKRNPLIEVTSQPTKGDNATYQPNTYIAASLMGRTQKSKVNGRTYAFVRPKPQEYAKYEWSIYSAENQFYIPAPSETQNRFKLAGGFIANFDLHEYTVPTLEEKAYYPFDAITRLKPMATEAQVLKNGPRRIESDFAPFVDGGISPWFEVFPLNLPTGDPIVTGINDVETNRGDAIIRYIDAMGHCSVQPFKGFNIVVIQQGGQRRVQKVIKQ